MPPAMLRDKYAPLFFHITSRLSGFTAERSQKIEMQRNEWCVLTIVEGLEKAADPLKQ